jgi:hypothetical protein
LDEFLEALSSVDRIYQDTIRYSRIFRKDATNPNRRQVVVQISTLVQVYLGEEIDSEYILEVGISCGRDIVDSDPELLGSEKARQIKEQLIDIAESRRWKVLPGILDL